MGPCPSVCLWVSVCRHFGDPLILGYREGLYQSNFPAKHVPHHRSLGVPLLEPAIHRFERVLAIKRCSKTCFVAICRHHTPMGIFKLPRLFRWRQMATKRCLDHIWRVNRNSLWIMWNQKCTFGEGGHLKEEILKKVC